VSQERLSQIGALKTQVSPTTIDPLLPVLADILLPAVKAHSQVSTYKHTDNSNIIDILIEGAELKDDVMQGRKELDTNALLVLRTFVNLFDGEQGRELLLKEYEKV